jgi:hypothetical protein
MTLEGYQSAVNETGRIIGVVLSDCQMTVPTSGLYKVHGEVGASLRREATLWKVFAGFCGSEHAGTFEVVLC